MNEFDREDYYRLLQTARRNGQERLYLLVKLVASTGLSLKDLQTLKLEDIQTGGVRVTRAQERRTAPVPDCLRREVLRCVRRSGQKAGLLFTRRDGQPMGTAFVSNSVRRLSAAPSGSRKSCSIRDLQRLYYDAAAQVGEQGVCDLIESEQPLVSWDPPGEDKSA